jgi:hypothetical protein
MCLTFKRVIIVLIAGVDNPTADNYRQQIVQSMGYR